MSCFSFKMKNMVDQVMLQCHLLMSVIKLIEMNFMQWLYSNICTEIILMHDELFGTKLFT